MAMLSGLGAMWKDCGRNPGAGPVYVSMNDYLVRRLRDVPRVALEGMRLRRRWPQVEGALGLWVASFRYGRRQVSVSIWRSREDLRSFVESQDHVRIMHAFKDAGLLYTNAWMSERFDAALIWQQAVERLSGAIDGVRHH